MGFNGSSPCPLQIQNMNKQSTGYKAMLRDRVPLLVNLALKWCKAKECWINHVYDNFVNIYVDKEQRYEATRIVLGISGKYRNFEFNKTIAWDNLTDEETKSWKTVENWVKWFQNCAMEIKEEYEQHKYVYNSTEIQMYLVDKFLDTQNEDLAYKLVSFIIKSI